MWVPGPFTHLDTSAFFKSGGGDSILHSDSFLLTIADGGSLAPIPGNEVVIHLMEEVASEDVAQPHTEGTVTVDGVFLEISVHFVGVWVGRKRYCKSRSRD